MNADNEGQSHQFVKANDIKIKAGTNPNKP